MNILHALFFRVAHGILIVVVVVSSFFVNFTAQKNSPTPPKPPETPKTETIQPAGVFPVASTLSSTTPTTPIQGISKTKQATTPTKTGAVQNSTPPTPPAQEAPSVSPDTLNTQTRAALVNILCTTRAGGSFNPISGSGVMVTSSGVILTNAHVAQYLLLRDYPTPNNVDCVVRTGSPAEPLYRASVLYLPPVWIDQNASKIATKDATSTGENDYAFLLITSRIDGSPLPALFPFVSVTTDPPHAKESAYLAAYPAQYLGGVTIQKSLYASSAYSAITELYGFQEKSPSVDLFSLAGSVVSQSGSSGGAVARLQDGALEGIITTEHEGTTTADRMLYAITLEYIDRSLASFGQGSIVQLLSEDIAKETLNFTANTAPALTQKLIDALK